MTVETHDASHKDDTPDWMSRLSRHRPGLAALSFGESTVMPIPLETLVVPLMIGHPRRALAIAVWIWVGCLLGAALFYAAGLWLSDPVVIPALEALGLGDDFTRMRQRLDAEGLFWTVFLVSLLPAPMQFATLGAGAADGNLLVFFAAIAASRGIRYFGLALLAQIVGERLQHMHIPKRYLVPGLMLAMLAAWGVMQLF